MASDAMDGQGPNWLVIGVFTSAGAGLLAVAYHMSSFWENVFINGGTALLLFALLAFSGPMLIHQLREPQTLDEALVRVAALVAPFSQKDAGSADIQDHATRVRETVLKTVAKTGLHQKPPASSSVCFVSLGGSSNVEWRVEWDEKGLRHLVTANGNRVPSHLSRCINWTEKSASHERQIYKILCYLLRALTISDG